MPFYDYKCLKCGKVFEVKQGISEPYLKFCLYCNNEGVERLISGASIAFKGTGFYINDYATPNINTNKEAEK